MAPSDAPAAPPEVRRANEIAAQFEAAEPAAAAAAIATHVRSFWDPRMRHALVSYARTGAEGLEPSVLAAVTLLEQNED
jgi:formate dehydrogenase subunit delta